MPTPGPPGPTTLTTITMTSPATAATTTTLPPATLASDAPGTPRIVVVSGGTGAVGKALVNRLLAHPDITIVRALVRRAGGLSEHPKLQEIVLDWDVLSTSETLKAALTGATDAYCALGTTLKQAGSKPAFEKVDYHYVVEYARAAKTAGVQRFLLVSALGAGEKSLVFYSRVKGRAELAVTTLEFPATVIAQPALLLTDKRADSRPVEAVSQKIMPALNAVLKGPLAPYQGVSADTVAGALVRAAFAGTTHGVVRLRAPFET